MDIQPGKRHQSYSLFIILLLAFVTDQICSRLIPWEKFLVGIHPSVVFLDIPVPLPCTVALVPFLLFFILFYRFFLSQTGVEGSAASAAKKKMLRVLGALIILPALTICTGMIYLAIHDLLPRGIQNALESFGVNEDLYLPWRGDEVIHFRGSMLILGACWAGFYNLKRQLKTVPKMAPVESHAGKPFSVSAEKAVHSPHSKKEGSPVKSAELVR
jgi:hypothetical protein